MSVRENLAFGLKMRGLDRREVSERVAEVAASLDIAPLLERKPAQLSGGQRQRVALGRAIARKAKVFLLDEPLSNLDVQLRVTTRAELARLHRSLHVPMVYVTHDQEEAMTLGDRIVVMHSGRFLQVGAPMEIYERPATQFVGGFVGSPRMNFFPGKLTLLDGGGSRIDALGATIGLEAARAPEERSTKQAREVVVGMRPEDAQIVRPADADLQATVDVVEPLGRETLLHLVLREQRGAPATELRVLTGAGTAGVEPGSKVGLRFRRERIHLFDPATEMRL
jgi:multiple sugar transport system ATP-binding protein